MGKKSEMPILFKVGDKVLLRNPQGYEWEDRVRKVTQWVVWLEKSNAKFSSRTGWSSSYDPNEHSRIELLPQVNPQTQIA
jgi:hypothetical protein